MKAPVDSSANWGELRFAIELRDGPEGCPGLLSGTLLTYGEVSPSHREVFAPGALSWPKAGIVLNRQHNRGLPIMRVVPQQDGNRVLLNAPLPDTVAGRDAAQEVRDGLFRGLSVEFHAVRDVRRAGLRHVLEAVLRGAGLVTDPSYTGSLVTVRSAGQVDRQLAAWL